MADKLRLAPRARAAKPEALIDAARIEANPPQGDSERPNYTIDMDVYQ